MIQFIMAIARTASVPPWTRSKPWASISYYSLSYAFMEVWSWASTIFKFFTDVGFKLLICFRYYLTWTWFVLTLIRTLMDELYLWTLCNVWDVCWIMYDLGCMWIIYRDPSWYSIDYRVYMGSSMTVRLLAGCHCTCALINWSVIWHRWAYGWLPVHPYYHQECALL